MEKTSLCPNCGAQVETDSSRCPYCGYINEEGATKRFRKDLGDIRRDIEETQKEPARALARGFTGGTKVILITAGVLVVLALVFALELFRETRDKPRLFMSAEEQEYASAYTLAAGEQLTEAYESGDIARMAQIFDKAYSVDRINLWGVPHYEAGYASSCYMKLQQALSDLDKGELSEREAEELTYCSFYFYYRAYGDDGAKIFDPIRQEEIIPIINDRLGYTSSDMEDFRSRVFYPPNVNRSDVYKTTRKYYKNYH